MRKNITTVFILMFVGLCLFARKNNGPHIGYVYPAGGCVGTEFQVIIGGQKMWGLESGFVSGKGVEVKSVEVFRPVRNFNNVRRQLRRFLKQSDKGVFELDKIKVSDDSDYGSKNPSLMEKRKLDEKKSGGDLKKRQYLSDEELIEILKGLSPLQLELVIKETLVRRNRLQMSPAISQIIIAKIKISKDAAPGVRELRLITRQGISGGLKFIVGTLPETKYPAMTAKERDPIATADLPVVLNGQIMPGEVDRFRFSAKEGEEIQFSLLGRTLVPYMGDAVPGWFQPVMSIYDSDGKELAYADDNKFDPDPVILFTAPDFGEYELRIRDSIYRGREDFVYRVTMNKPMIPVAVPGKASLHAEKEPNNFIKKAMKVKLPIEIEGKINRPGDVDVYSFRGKKGQELVMKINARKLDSPVDSQIKLMNEYGKVLCWNDDMVQKNVGIKTHHADSYLKYILPANGEYFMQVSDTQRHGGNDFFYRLNIGKATPGFKLYTQPSAVSISGGITVPVKILAVREDGYSGPVNIKLKSAPEWLKISGGTIQPGKGSTVITLSATKRKLEDQVIPIKIQGEAKIDGKQVCVDVVPTDEKMQAFIYKHLVPAAHFYINARRRGYNPVRSIVQKGIKAASGGTFQVDLKSWSVKPHIKMEFKVMSPASGVSVVKTEKIKHNYRLTLAVDSGMKPGSRDNLVIECILEVTHKKDGKVKVYRRVAGVMPAIPFEVVEKK